MASSLLYSQCLGFSLDLYKQLVAQSNHCGNIVYSPLSITCVLSMARAGARGDTATELTAVLRTQDSDPFYRHFRGFFSKYACQTFDVRVYSANQIYCERSFPLLATYRSIIQDRYDATIESVDFREDYEDVRDQINARIEEVTRSKIEGFLLPESLDALTSMIFVNAVHMKGFWESQFSPTKTIRSSFSGSKGTKEVFMMNRMGKYKTTSCDDLSVRAVEIPYRGGLSSMVVILPKERDGLAALEERLTASKLAELLKNLCYQGDIFLHLPKFKLEQAVNFKVNLQGIGIKKLFTPDANLSGISGTPNLFAKDLFHKVVLEVDEEGEQVPTDYTLSTVLKQATMLNLSCQFAVDQPFMFLVRVVDYNIVLCMGSIRDL